MKVYTEEFGVLDNQHIQALTMVNDNGVEITCINYGCTITKIMAPDRNGVFENIVLGFDCLEEYLNHSSYFGCIVGRVAGRINNARFELDGRTYNLTKNQNGNCLHSGEKNFSHVVWEAVPIEGEQRVGVQFTYLSPDGEEGFPGNLQMKVTYTLNNDNEFLINYEGTSDKKTILNVTNHSYFNLSGNVKKDILDHSLEMSSNQFLELNEESIPTGKLVDVENTPFDFRKEKEIGVGVKSNHQQIELVGQGYDHPFVLTNDKRMVLADKESGRQLQIKTDAVGVVLYTGNSLEGDYTVQGKKTRKYLGVCLETQGLPDAINQPNFPSIILDKDEVYRTYTKFTFGTIK